LRAAVQHGQYGHVKKARIAELKNNLSRYLDQVRHGETVLVVDRDQPIAQLVPLQSRTTGQGADGERLARLERRGLVRRGTGELPDWLGKRKPPRLRRSALRDMLKERESGW
jgi:prevent-host-death family protein